jgi:hypothetical protein
MSPFGRSRSGRKESYTLGRNQAECVAPGINCREDRSLTAVESVLIHLRFLRHNRVEPVSQVDGFFFSESWRRRLQTQERSLWPERATARESPIESLTALQSKNRTKLARTTARRGIPSLSAQLLMNARISSSQLPRAVSNFV